eukprot:scaffold1134_cov57-Phaeocystis_antarctica.AAC.4
MLMSRLTVAIFVSLLSWCESFTSTPTLLEGASSTSACVNNVSVGWDAAALQKLYAEEGLLFTAFNASEPFGDHDKSYADLTYVCGGEACGGKMNAIFWPDTANPGQEPRTLPYLILHPNVTWKPGGCAYIQDAGDSSGKGACPGPGQVDPKTLPATLAKSFIEDYTNPTPPNIQCKSHFDSWSTGSGGFPDPSAERESFVATYNSFYQMLKPLIKSPPPQRKKECKNLELQMQENQINQPYCKSDVLAIGYTETYNGDNPACKDDRSIAAANKLHRSTGLPLIKMTRRSEGSIVPSDPCKVLFSVYYPRITFTDASIEFTTVS